MVKIFIFYNKKINNNEKNNKKLIKINHIKKIEKNKK